MNKNINTISKILKFLTPLVVSISLLALSVDVVKYSGFIQKHFFIDTLILLGMGVLLSYFLMIIDLPINYWWLKNPFKLLQTQSKIILPVSVVLYIALFSLENLNYPNYVFSKYAIDLVAYGRFIFGEFVIFSIPFLAIQAKRHLVKISKELKLSEVVVGFGLVVLFTICLIVRMI